MTRSEFLSEVVKTYFNQNCTVSEAIDITKKRLGISDAQFQDWFRGYKSDYKVN